MGKGYRGGKKNPNYGVLSHGARSCVLAFKGGMQALRSDCRQIVRSSSNLKPGRDCIVAHGLPRIDRSAATPSLLVQIVTDDQEETALLECHVGNGGQESACGWCKDKWGISWQIALRGAGGRRAEAKRAFDAMMDMRKVDVAVIEAARRG